jgi:hypothetical protein
MLQDRVHQVMEMDIKQHVVGITVPHLSHHLLDVLVGHMSVRAQHVVRLPSLVGPWGGEARIFKESLEFQGDTDLGGDLLPQLRITAVFIVLKEIADPLMIGVQPRQSLGRLAQGPGAWCHGVFSSRHR